jgi:hypothetical protein
LSVPDTVTDVAFVAVTVRMEDPPATIDVGFAVMPTVGDCADTTETVVVAEVFPPLPVAVAVYVVVVVGVTVCVPPVAPKVYVVPSVPVTVTLVASVAVTVKVDVPPEVTDPGLAVRVTVGATVLFPPNTPHPLSRRGIKSPVNTIMQ